MAFAKLSGSLLESDARPARTPEQAPVPVLPSAEERAAPAVDPLAILQRLRRLAEAAPLYDSLWNCIRSGDEEGVAQVVAELVRAGRPVSEISDVVESLSKVSRSGEPDASEKPADGLPRAAASPELSEGSSHPDPDEMRDAEVCRADNDPVVEPWERDRAPEPQSAIVISPHPELDIARWQEPTRISEPAIAAQAEPRDGAEHIPYLLTATGSAKPASTSFSARAYLGAALAAVVVLGGGGVFLISQPAVTQVGAATAFPANGSVKLALDAAAPRAGEVTQPAPDNPVARAIEVAKAAPVQPPVPAPSAIVKAIPAEPAMSALPPIGEPGPKPSENPSAAAQTAAPAAGVTAPAPLARPAIPAGVADRPEAKLSTADAQASVKAVSVVPVPPDQPEPASPMPPAAPSPSDRAASDRAEPNPVVASLEPPNGALLPRSPSGPPATVESAIVKSGEPALSKEPVPAPADTAPLLERGDRLFGTGDIASARLFYERAADAGNGQAALRLGETYDPAFLQRAQLRVAGDRGLAVFWYGRARELGADEAEILLKGMQTR